MKSLFVEPAVSLEKVSGEVHLPDDPNEWPKEILDELFKQVPYIADFRPHVVMSKVDAERGYGLGHIEISNDSEAQMGTPPEQLESAGIRNVRIPIVIREGKMSPFDLLVNDAGIMMPLTESRLRQAIFRPQMFDITSKTPGDQSMIGQLYPPYRQNHGFGGGGISVPADGMGKAGSILPQFAGRGFSSHEEELMALLEGNDKGFRNLPEAKEASAAKLPDGSGCFTATVGAVGKKAGGKEKKSSAILPDIAHTINRFDLDTFWGAINDDPSLRAAFKKNAAATNEALKVLAHIEPRDLEKQAAALPYYIKPTVTQISHCDEGYTVKTASSMFWRVYETLIDRGELVAQFGEKVAMVVDTHGCVTIAEDANEATVEKKAEVEIVTHPGIYKVYSQDEGAAELVGFVIPNLLDTDGQALPLSVFTNGAAYAVQTEIYGEQAGDGPGLPTGPISGNGFFAGLGPDGSLKATVPMELQGSSQMPGDSEEGLDTHMGSTFDGRPVEVSVQPNIVEPTGTPEGKLLIPMGWKWTPLDKGREVSLAGGDENSDPEAAAAKEQMGMANTEPAPPPPGVGTAEGGPAPPPTQGGGVEKKSWVDIRGSYDQFTFSGPAVEKLAAAGTDMQLMYVDDAMFILAGLGVEQNHAVSKLAEACDGTHVVHVVTGREIVPAGEVEKYAADRAREVYANLPQLKHYLIKEAASMPDPAAVDTVLSLGFINPENIMSFVGHIPELDENQGKLCNLLLAARLGMPNVSASALERSVRAIEEVIEGLKVISFQG